MEDSAELFNNLYIDMDRFQDTVRRLLGRGGNLNQIYAGAESRINSILRFLRNEIPYEDYLAAQPIEDRLESIRFQLVNANRNSPQGLRALIQNLEQVKRELVNNFDVRQGGILN